jgi:hypothetical protein
MGMTKKRSVLTVVLFLLIPVVLTAGGMLFNLINPEIAAGHPNYGRNFHLLSLLKTSCFLVAAAVVVALWVLVCLLVIRSKQRSDLWLALAVLGPLGFAVLVSLNDRTSTEPDRYTRFVRNLNWLVRIGYEIGSFVILWELAYQAMVLKRTLMIRYEAFTTGVSTAQIIDIQNASSGMWAFGEGLEVMYLVILLYLLRPFVFRMVGHVMASMASPETAG